MGREHIREIDCGSVCKFPTICIYPDKAGIGTEVDVAVPMNADARPG
jgi:hypothetical protein